MPATVAQPFLETEGNSVAVRCLNEVLDASGVQDKVLAAECGYSRSRFSKIASGQSGNLLDLVYRLPPHRAALRAQFFAKLSEHESFDPVISAAEQLMTSAARFMRLAAATGIRPRMVKASAR